MRYYYTVWKCRCCGEKFESLEARSNRDLFADMYNKYTSERYNNIPHKCDPEYTGVVDFIGIKIAEHK